jgi:hypothetical protein
MFCMTMAHAREYAGAYQRIAGFNVFKDRIALFPDSWMEKVWTYEQQHLYPMCHLLHFCHVVRFMIESGTFKIDSKWANSTGPSRANSVASAAFQNIVFACRRGKKVSIYNVATVLFKGHVNG